MNYLTPQQAHEISVRARECSLTPFALKYDEKARIEFVCVNDKDSSTHYLDMDWLRKVENNGL